MAMAPPPPSSLSLHRTLVSASTTTTTTTSSSSTRSRYKNNKGCDTQRLTSGGRTLSSSSRVSLHNSSSRRIDTPVLAMTEGEADITSVQELADGSLVFSFSGAQPPQSKKTASQPRGEQHIDVDAPTHRAPVRRPRSTSQFQKRSPIPASAGNRKGRPGHRVDQAAEVIPLVQEKLQETVGSTVEANLPPRFPSAFSKRSPIPSKKESSSVSSSEIVPEMSPAPVVNEHGASANAKNCGQEPSKESPLSQDLQEIVGRGPEFLVDDGNSDNGLKSETHTSRGGNERQKSLKISVSVEHFEAHVSSENGSITQDLSSYKLAELRSLAKARGLKGYSKLKKGELLDLLNASES
ncbi:unnamed protein product [Sphagnum compactum]